MMFSDDWRDGNGKYARTSEREPMTVAGVVMFTEMWRVEIELPGAQNGGVAYDVLADNIGHAMALAVAFFNRERAEAQRISAAHVMFAKKQTTPIGILVPSTVEALHYPDAEVTADIKATPMRKEPAFPPPHPQGCFCTQCMPTHYTNAQQPELPIHDDHAPLPTGPLISRGAIARDQRNDATRGFTTRATVTDDDGTEK